MMPRPAGSAQRVFAFKCGVERVDWGLLDESRSGDGEVVLPHFRFLILHDEGPVMFDTGGNPIMASRPADHVAREDLRDYDLSLDDGEDLVSQLDSVGVDPSAIDHVVISHLHWDHAGCLNQLRHATVHVQASEHAFAHNPDAAQRTAYIRRDFGETRSWHFADGDHDLFGDGAITMISTPGHTPGHQSLLVRLENSTILIMGDAAYDREMMELGRLPNFAWDKRILYRSWQRIFDICDRFGAELVFPHDRHYRSTMRIAPDAHYD